METTKVIPDSSEKWPWNRLCPHSVF